MATFRNVKTSFWNDRKVINDFSPEDKYFLLYLLTNPMSTQLGIYEFVPKKAAFDMGYSLEAVKVLLDRFENKYDMIRYSDETGEIAIKNFLHHSIVKGGKPVMDCLKKEESEVKDKSLVVYVINSILNIDNLNNTVLEFIDYISTKEYIKNDNDKERIVNVSSRNEHDTDKEADELFNSVWKLYPKKRGKGSVSPTQKRKLLKIGFDELSRCIDRYKKDKDGTDIQYIQNGSTFFNSGYKDYLDSEWYESHPKENPTEPKKDPYEGLDIVLSTWDGYSDEEVKTDRLKHKNYSIDNGYWIPKGGLRG